MKTNKLTLRYIFERFAFVTAPSNFSLSSPKPKRGSSSEEMVIIRTRTLLPSCQG